MDSTQRAHRRKQVTRRKFLERGILSALGLAIGGTVAATASVIRPSSGARASVILTPSKRRNGKRPTPERYESESLRMGFYVVEYPEEAAAEAAKIYPRGTVDGILAGTIGLSRRCPHMGYIVGFCESSQWFECPAHGSQFNAVGERRGGPAPHGMDLLANELDDSGRLHLYPATVMPGVPDGTDSTGQKAEGPHCVGGGH